MVKMPSLREWSARVLIVMGDIDVSDLGIGSLGGFGWSGG